MEEKTVMITQDFLIRQIAATEEIDVETVRQIFAAIEEIVFFHLSSAEPSEQLNIKLWNGLHIERKYVERKSYTKGMFQNIDCREHVQVKAKLSKYYNGEVNKKLFQR